LRRAIPPPAGHIEAGILIGYWDEAEVAAEKAKRDAYRAERVLRLRS
jgi:hypothetical protein